MLKLAAYACAVALSSFTFACSDAAPSTPDAGGGIPPGTVIDAGNYTLTVLAPATPSGSCDVHAEQPSQFTDSTEAFGLTNVAGSGYSADLNHDGYPDFVVLSGNADQRETIPTIDGAGVAHNLPDGGVLYDVSVLMNRPSSNGGRTFVDETQQSGMFQVRGGSTAEYRMAQLVSFADVDNDGNLDVYSGISFDPNNSDKTSSFNQDRNEILLNDGQGHFNLAPQSDPSGVLESSNYQAVYTDVDNDGALDLLLTFWYKNPSVGTPEGSQQQLFRGNGDGTFQSMTQSAGLMLDNTGSTSSILMGKDSRPSFGAAACDLDGDGYPELLISSYGGQSNMLYKNDGTGGFTRFIQTGGYDGDTIVDYSDNQYFRCYCTAHSSDAYCSGAAKPNVVCPTPADSYWQKGVDDSAAMLNGNNFSAACGDIDGDGRPDIFQGTIRHWWAGVSTDPSQILLNQTTPGGDLSFARQDGATTGITYPHLDPLGWNEGIQQSALVDMDNDGRTDILNGGSDYAYQYGHLFIQQADGTFQDLAQQWGMIFPCMDGLAVADYDRDGDLDVIVRGSLFRDCATGWAPLSGGKAPAFAGYKVPEMHIFTNNASEHSSWVQLRLVSSDGATNRMGIGATVTVTANGVAQTQQMLGAHGIGSESDDPGVLHFGLGACGAIDSIVVRWPNQSQSKDTWVNVPANHLVELHQADTTIYGVNLPK